MRRSAWLMFLPLLAASAVTSALLSSTICMAAHRPTPCASTEGSASAPIDSTAPREVGDADSRYWGKLSDEEQTAAVAQLKAMAERATALVKRPLHLHESRLFLLYSDVPEVEVSRYGLLLDRMYARMAELFGIDKNRNLFRGKALVFIFSRIEDYRLFERLSENNDPGGSVAMTSCFGDGMVHIAFYRYPDELLFAHLLVHESVHGFLHRYRSPAHVPSWANEGLADAVAAELAPDGRRAAWIVRLAQTGLRQHGDSLGDFFTTQHLDGWQYPLAEGLCTFMLKQNRRGYLDFINGIKDGQPWEQSLVANFKMTKERLIEEFGKSMGQKSIRP